jgi:hypothetical protein
MWPSIKAGSEQSKHMNQMTQILELSKKNTKITKINILLNVKVKIGKNDGKIKSLGWIRIYKISSEHSNMFKVQYHET